MKIQCDVCNKEEASVFCTADEAAICDSCDHRVHHANKLASKHQRFSLLHPSSKNFPLCDVCQEKRAFLFCQQDRAILCKDCDVSIHTANELTQKHNRFLLTGVKLSANSAVYIPGTSASSSVTKNQDLIPDSKHPQQSAIKKTVSVSTPTSSSCLNSMIKTATLTSVGNKQGGDNLGTIEGIGSTSSISEYLEMLPGWQVEDFFDTPSTPFGVFKPGNGILSFGDDGDNRSSNLSSESLGIWVPQATSIPVLPACENYQQLGGQNGWKEITKEATNMKGNSSSIGNRRWTEDVFAVPQISPPSNTGSKRSRPFW